MMQPDYTQEWSVEFQRWLRTYWDDAQQRYYRSSCDPSTGQWHFFDWLPIPAQTRIEPIQNARNTYSVTYGSGYNQQAQATGGALASSQPAQPSLSRKADLIQGTYPTRNTQSYETLDPAYFVRNSSFFDEGTAFAVLFTEPAGNTTQKYNNSISYVQYQQAVHTQIRRFIVVRNKKGFCYACPIFTYGDKATTKPGVSPHEHAIVYSEGQTPRLIDGEASLSKLPICVTMNEGERPLTVYSRICFGIHHPIQHNVKVKHLGHVKNNDIARMRGYWKMENADSEAPANNPAEAVAEATQDDTGDQLDPMTTNADSYVYDAETNPHCYHAECNPYGYHPAKTQYCYHPVYNPEGYHSQLNPSGYHPESNPNGYHSVRNPWGYHPATSPYAWHPTFNRYGYHYHFNAQGYHPSVNPGTYHPLHHPRTG